MDGKCCVEPKRANQVTEKSQKLDKAIDLLSDVTQVLIERLAAVTKDASPTEACNDADECLVPLARILAAQERRIQVVIGSISDITGRLEV